jgi:hypothetical protein
MHTVGTATLSADRAYSCPGTEVVFTCVVNTIVLSWDIDFLGRHDDIDRVLFDASDSTGSQLNIITRQGTVYSFNRTSKSPLTCTMAAIASTDLSGATISCRDGPSIASSAHVDTLVVEIMPGRSSYSYYHWSWPAMRKGAIWGIINFQFSFDKINVQYTFTEHADLYNVMTWYCYCTLNTPYTQQATYTTNNKPQMVPFLI